MGLIDSMIFFQIYSDKTKTTRFIASCGRISVSNTSLCPSLVFWFCSEVPTQHWFLNFRSGSMLLLCSMVIPYHFMESASVFISVVFTANWLSLRYMNTYSDVRFVTAVQHVGLYILAFMKFKPDLMHDNHFAFAVGGLLAGLMSATIGHGPISS